MTNTIDKDDDSDLTLITTPTVIVGADFEQEILQTKTDVYDKDFANGVRENAERMETQLTASIRAVFIVDVLLFFVINGAQLKIPGTEITTGNIPFFVEVQT